MKVAAEYALLQSLLERPIAFHRIFAAVSGSVLAGLMLSQAYYWTPRGQSDDGWFYKTQAEWEEETGMSRWEQETARKKLLKVVTISGDHVWQEERRGVPARLWYHLDVRALYDCIIQEGEEATIKSDASPQSSMLESHNLECGEPTIKNVAGAQSFYTENTSEISSEITQKGSGLDALWESVLEQLKSGTQPAIYKKWVAPTRLLDLGDGVATIQIADAEGKDWLENRLAHGIKRELTISTGSKIAKVVVLAQG